MESKCMKEITVKVVGMEQLPVGGLMGKKCMSVLTPMVLGMGKKRHGDLMVLQLTLHLKSLFCTPRQKQADFRRVGIGRENEPWIFATG